MRVITHHGILEESEGSLTWNGRDKILNPLHSPCELKHGHKWILHPRTVNPIGSMQRSSNHWNYIPCNGDTEGPDTAMLMAATEPASTMTWPWLGFLISESPLVPVICFVSLILHTSQWFQALPYTLPKNSFLLNLVSFFLLLATQNPDWYNTNGWYKTKMSYIFLVSSARKIETTSQDLHKT